jgi:hypothetical protein
MITENKFKWEIKKRKFYSYFDFFTSQILIWISILGSLATSALSLIQDSHLNFKYWIAALGLIPVALRLIKSNINFVKRAEWNKSYLIDLQHLFDSRESISPQVITDRFYDILRKKEKEWNSRSL